MVAAGAEEEDAQAPERLVAVALDPSQLPIVFPTTSRGLPAVGVVARALRCGIIEGVQRFVVVDDENEQDRDGVDDAFHAAPIVRVQLAVDLPPAGPPSEVAALEARACAGSETVRAALAALHADARRDTTLRLETTGFALASSLRLSCGERLASLLTRDGAARLAWLLDLSHERTNGVIERRRC